LVERGKRRLKGERECGVRREKMSSAFNKRGAESTLNKCGPASPYLINVDLQKKKNLNSESIFNKYGFRYAFNKNELVSF
jgi:hypothetical protein